MKKSHSHYSPKGMKTALQKASSATQSSASRCLRFNISPDVISAVHASDVAQFCVHDTSLFNMGIGLWLLRRGCLLRSSSSLLCCYSATVITMFL